MLDVVAVTKTFGGVVALDRCTFHVKPGTVTALIGPNGAGKTTLLDVLTGLSPADSGWVRLNGNDVTNRPAYRIAAAGVSRTFQQVRLFRNATVVDHLLLASSNDDTLLWRAFGRHSFDSAFLERHLSRFRLEVPLATPVVNLSYGQRKLLQLAMAALKPHQLLLLDEPVAGVNNRVQQEIEHLLLALKEQPCQPGVPETIILVEHDIEFVRRLADWVVVLDAGRVLVAGEPRTVLADPRVLEAYLGD